MKILILGGNRFFGKKLAKLLVDDGDKVTLGNRGNLDDGLNNLVERVKVDRTNLESMKSAFSGRTFDVVYDQVGGSAQDINIAVNVFKENIGKFIFTSSLSVYSQLGPDLKETDVPEPILDAENSGRAYGKGKQDAENILSYTSNFSSILVRFPFVLGADDYLKRLEFHVDKVLKNEPIYFPNVSAKFSPIHSTDAALALKFLLDKNFSGPINVSPIRPIALSAMMGWIENSTQQAAVYSRFSEPTLNSPYGIQRDWFMNVERLKNLGFEAAPIKEWMPGLIRNAIEHMKEFR